MFVYNLKIWGGNMWRLTFIDKIQLFHDGQYIGPETGPCINERLLENYNLRKKTITLSGEWKLSIKIIHANGLSNIVDFTHPVHGKLSLLLNNFDSIEQF